MGNAKCHPESLQSMNPNVKVVFLPPNTTLLIQLMAQTVILTFKAYYPRQVMKKMIESVAEYSDKSIVPAQRIKSFWKKFLNLNSILIVDDS